MNSLLELLKNSLNDKNGKVSHKRILVYASWLILVAAFISSTYFRLAIDQSILYLFGGFVGGGMGLSILEKQGIKPQSVDIT